MLLGTALSGLLLLSGVPVAQARDRDYTCHERIERAERRLRHAELRYGAHSRRARHRRHQLEELREHCSRDRD